MRFDSDFVPWLYGVRLPTVGSDLTHRAHFECPIDRAAGGGIHSRNMQPAVRVRIFELFQCPGYGNHLFVIKHRERMMRISLNGKDGGSNGNEAGDSKVHDFFLPDDS